jgi:HSP20 family molecular chaperone IbpA
MKGLMRIFDDIREMERILSRLYEETFYTDMYVKKGEKPNETILHLDVPGVEKDGIKIFTRGRELVVEATRNDREKENTKRFSYLSESGDIKVKKASLKNGVLTLVLEEGPSVDEVQIEIE